MKRTEGILEEPITTFAEAQTAIREIIRRGILWHFEDDPAEIVDRDGERFFSDEEAADLRDRVEEIYEFDFATDEEPDYCPIGFALAVEDEMSRQSAR